MEAMRTHFYILFLLVAFTSCDDGDIIVNNFNFEDSTLRSCAKVGKSKVLYITNNEDNFETISLQANNPSFSDLAGILIDDTTPEVTFDLSSTNRLIYRTYNSEVPTNYFCTDIPPSNPKVIQEFVSVGGKVIITTTRNLTGIKDRDGDGINDVDELDEDTDGDGIMNIDDIDDDGDNVLTSTEKYAADNQTELQDTDKDDKPNYLDKDDDGDGVDTRFEVSEGALLPTDSGNFNDANLPNYLNPFVSNEYTGEIKIRPNELKITYRSTITIENLQLQNQDGSGEVISFENYELGTFISATDEIILEPINPEPEPETEN